MLRLGVPPVNLPVAIQPRRVSFYHRDSVFLPIILPALSLRTPPSGPREIEATRRGAARRGTGRRSNFGSRTRFFENAATCGILSRGLLHRTKSTGRVGKGHGGRAKRWRTSVRTYRAPRRWYAKCRPVWQPVA